MPGRDYDYLFKFIVIGDANSGKTAFINQFADHTWSSDYMATIGIDFKDTDHQIDDKKFRLQIWDTAGQEKFSIETESLYRGTHAVIVCCNLINEDSFKNIDMRVQQAKELSKENTPIFLVGTHSDETDKLVVTEAALKEKALDLGCQDSFIVSGRTGENVENTFTSVATSLMNKAQQKQVSLQEKTATSPRISREALHQTYCQHVWGARVFSGARVKLFGFFNGNGRSLNAIIEDLKVRARDHDGASRKTCDELDIKYNQPSNGPK